ncbi:ATP-binding protein, partial [Alienimonas sp. DA493]|uniref:ATP-binding protein n=1 Tax=Alienimonas sp. DA493 TaxID=3373605 RepID=UPI0037553EB8
VTLPHGRGSMSDDFDARLRDAKLAAMAEFCAGAGHEINNPAAAIHGRCSLLLRNCEDPTLARELRVISEQALRIRDMIADALLFADPPEPTPEPVWLGEVAEEALPGLRERAADAGCTLETDFAPVALEADPDQLSALVASLGRNAIEAGASRLRFRGRRRGERALLWVADDGAGFTEQERRHAFDPFFSGRQAGRGLGFGLPKCWRIVTLHGGTLDVRSFPGRTVFRASLPALPADAAGPSVDSA